MSENENPLGLCPQCLEKLRPVVDEVISRLKHVDEELLKLRGGCAEW
jgi:hypothetical protein